MRAFSTISECGSSRRRAAAEHPTVLVLALSVLVTASCRVRAEGAEAQPGIMPAPPVQQPPPSSPLGLPRSFAELAARVQPSVVSVYTKQPVKTTPLGGGFFPQRELFQQGLGSGFVIDPAGYVLTNRHVIGDAASIQVQLHDETEYPATVVGMDQDTDIALLRIEAPNLAAAPLGNSETLAVGDWVVAIGSPFDLSHTVTAGIVSAKGRTNAEVPLDPFGLYNFIQTDASINQGNSGGPLLDVRGEVVGINTAIHAAAQGIGFAIPIDMVKVILPHLRTRGRFERSWIGVEVSRVPPAQVQQLRLGSAHGALVQRVEPRSPAAAAGLSAGDVILEFDGHVIAQSAQLPWLAGTAGVGHRARLRIWRAGQPRDVVVVLGPMPQLQAPR